MLALKIDEHEQRIIHDQVYPFLWLDELVFRKLDPLQPQWIAPAPGELAGLAVQCSNELWTVFASLKHRIFNLVATGDIQTVLLHYLDSAEALAAQAKRNLASYPNDAAIVETGEYLVWALADFERAAEDRFEKYLKDGRQKKKQPGTPEDALFKVLCKLSVDQIGIALKACDDTKLIIAKSLSIVFQSIVPFLSTDRMKHISWGSMRKSTYQFSRSDLESVIAVLERLIAKIREYY